MTPSQTQVLKLTPRYITLSGTQLELHQSGPKAVEREKNASSSSPEGYIRNKDTSERIYLYLKPMRGL